MSDEIEYGRGELLNALSERHGNKRLRTEVEEQVFAYFEGLAGGPAVPDDAFYALYDYVCDNSGEENKGEAYHAYTDWAATACGIGARTLSRRQSRTFPLLWLVTRSA